MARHVVAYSGRPESRNVARASSQAASPPALIVLPSFSTFLLSLPFAFGDRPHGSVVPPPMSGDRFFDRKPFRRHRPVNPAALRIPSARREIAARVVQTKNVLHRDNIAPGTRRTSMALLRILSGRTPVPMRHCSSNKPALIVRGRSGPGKLSPSRSPIPGPEVSYAHSFVPRRSSSPAHAGFFCRGWALACPALLVPRVKRATVADKLSTA